MENWSIRFIVVGLVAFAMAFLSWGYWHSDNVVAPDDGQGTAPTIFRSDSESGAYGPPPTEEELEAILPYIGVDEDGGILNDPEYLAGQ